MKQPLLVLGVGILIAGILQNAVSYLYAGLGGAICATVALVICAVPALVSMLLACWGAKRAPSEQLMAIFGGMMLRMAVVLGFGLAVFLLAPWFKAEKSREYVYWANILVSYLFTLGLETIVLLRSLQSPTDTRVISEVGN